MIAQFVLTSLLAAVLLYAWTEYRRAPVVAFLTVFVATAGIYFVWVPEHSTQLAELVGIGRGNRGQCRQQRRGQADRPEDAAASRSDVCHGAVDTAIMP